MELGQLSGRGVEAMTWSFDNAMFSAAVQSCSCFCATVLGRM